MSEDVKTCKLTHDTAHSSDSLSAISSFSNTSTVNVHTNESVLFILCILFSELDTHLYSLYITFQNNININDNTVSEFTGIFSYYSFSKG